MLSITIQYICSFRAVEQGQVRRAEGAVQASVHLGVACPFANEGFPCEFALFGL